MNRHEKKRKALRWRIVRYIIMVSAIASIATLSVLVLLGYRFNRTTGVIQQGGLVQFMSEPTKARVTIGSAKLVDKTPSKITVNPGEYLVKMEKEKYRMWQKNVTIKAGEVLWLNSAKLIPRDIKTETTLSIPKVSDSFAQPGSGYISILPERAKPAIARYDIRSNTVKSESFNLASLKLAKADKHAYSFTDWDGDKDRAVLKHAYDNLSELVLVNYDDNTRSFVVSAIGKATPIDVIADPRNERNLVVRYSDGSVRLVDSDDGEVSPVVVSNVSTITSFGSSIVYTRTVGAGKVETGYVTLDSQQKLKPVRLINTKQPVRFQIQQYFDTYFVTTIIGKNVTLQRTSSLPRSSDSALVSLKLVTTFALDSVPLDIRALDAGQQVSIRQPSAVTNYDVELKALTSTDIAGAKQGADVNVRWLDQFHYYVDTDGTLLQYEYDGENQSDIVKVTPGYAAGYSQNGKYLYTVLKTENGFALQRSTMILDS